MRSRIVDMHSRGQMRENHDSLGVARGTNYTRMFAVQSVSSWEPVHVSSFDLDVNKFTRFRHHESLRRVGHVTNGSLSTSFSVRSLLREASISLLNRSSSLSNRFEYSSKSNVQGKERMKKGQELLL